MKTHGTRLALGAVAAVAMAAGCSSNQDVEFADGTIAGRAMIGNRPVVGADYVVTHVSKNGIEQWESFAEGTTDEQGTIHVKTGVRYGTFLVEVHGGRGTELVTGEPFDLDDDARMAAVITDFRADEQITTLQVSPLTTMAEALGEARLARGDKEADWAEAHARALELIGAHFGDVDPVVTQPIDPTGAPAGTLDESARHGLVHAALSQLATRIADTAGVSANVINSASLTEALVADLSSEEALFDGSGPDGELMLGMCPEPDVCPDEACSTLCDIGPATVRERLANELEAFVASGANVTGLVQEDIAEMKLRLAKNEEPELFGDAPTDTDGAPLAIEELGFYVDSDGIWWSKEDSPIIFGTVDIAENESVTITVQVNDDVEVAGRLLGDDWFGEGSWAAALPDGAFDPPPAANTLRVISRDSVGNQRQLEVEVRVDDGPAQVSFFETTVLDESADEIVSWNGGPGGAPEHDHAGQTVHLGGDDCPTVKKHISLMDGSDNPIAFKAHVTDTGSGIDPAKLQYRVRFAGSDEWLTDWASPDTVRDIAAGFEVYEVLHRDELPELATEKGEMEIVIRGIDHLERGGQAAACWYNDPLGPPLEATGAATGDLVTLDLSDTDLAKLLNGVSPDQGRSVLTFQVNNWHDEPVYFEVDKTETPLTGNKTWKRSAYVTKVEQVNLGCGANPSNCDDDWPYWLDADPTTEAVSLATPIGGTSVWDVTEDQAAQPCSGCGPNRYRIPAKPSPNAPYTYRVELVVTNLSPLHPGQNDTGNYTKYQLIDGGATYVLTGRDLGTFTRCTDVEKESSPYPNVPDTKWCEERTTYHRYLALTQFQVTIPTAFKGIVRSTTGPSRPPEELSFLKDKRPGLSFPHAWSSSITTPADAPGL